MSVSERLLETINMIVGEQRVGSGTAGNANLIDDLGFSSLQMLSLIMACENAFDVQLIDRSDLFERIVTIDGIVGLINEIGAANVPMRS